MKIKMELRYGALGMLLWLGLWAPPQAKACDGCALFAGVTPDAARNQVGLFFRHRTFSGLNYNPTAGTNKTDHFPVDGGFGHSVDDEGHASAKETFLTLRAFGRYFITTKLYAQIEIPFVSNAYHESGQKLGMTGLGDITLTAGYELFNAVKGDRVFQAFAAAGVKLPTGRRFPTLAEKLDWFDLQGSTESFDVQTSLQATWRKGKFGWQAFGMYRINTAASNGMRFGNFLNARAQGFGLFDLKEGAIQLMPYLGGYLEDYSGRYFGDSQVYGTGGTALALVSGVTFFTSRISIQPEIQIPLWQDLDDIQLLGRTVPTVQATYMF